jgi:tRNA threonylcarbamoyladenosine biosynthesis protein TsaE
MYNAHIKTVAELPKVAKSFLKAFENDRVFAFYGKMGAGKTTFIKRLCRELGSADNITSPSFALINEYTTSDGTVVYHFDFYRIKNIAEAFDMGYEDYIYSGNYCFIEWPEKIEEILPDGVVEVRIEESEDGTRTISAQRL